MNLQDLTYINTTAGRPSPQMTNDKWQEIFKLMKLIVKPSNQKLITTYNNKIVSNQFINDTYHGDTLYQTRMRLLNDNLRQIRNGEVDFVYYIYNIAELMKYEHDRLRSRFNQDGRYFEIWLDAS